MDLMNVNNYTFMANQDLLGEGQFGRVYRAHNTRNHRQLCVLKLVKRSADRQRDLLLRQQHQNETNILRIITQNYVSGNRYIIRMQNSFESNQYLGIEYEYDAKAADLGKLLHSRRFLTLCSAKEREITILQLFYQLLQGVQALHRLNIVHRDIKPENILLNQNGFSMKLIDFGLAKLLQTRSQYDKCSFVGTPAYMAPEVLTQSRANAMKADIYALGIVLYQMFYQGVLPFEQRVDRILIFGQRFVRTPREVQFNSSNQIQINTQNIIRSMLAINHDQRPDIQQVLQMKPFCDWTKGRESPDYMMPRMIQTGVQASARERVEWFGTHTNQVQQEAAIYSISPQVVRADQAQIEETSQKLKEILVQQQQQHQHQHQLFQWHYQQQLQAQQQLQQQQFLQQQQQQELQLQLQQQQQQQVQTQILQQKSSPQLEAQQPQAEVQVSAPPQQSLASFRSQHEQPSFVVDNGVNRQSREVTPCAQPQVSRVSRVSQFYADNKIYKQAMLDKREDFRAQSRSQQIRETISQSRERALQKSVVYALIQQKQLKSMGVQTEDTQVQATGTMPLAYAELTNAIATLQQQLQQVCNELKEVKCKMVVTQQKPEVSKENKKKRKRNKTHQTGEQKQAEPAKQASEPPTQSKLQANDDKKQGGSAKQQAPKQSRSLKGPSHTQQRGEPRQPCSGKGEHVKNQPQQKQNQPHDGGKQQQKQVTPSTQANNNECQKSTLKQGNDKKQVPKKQVTFQENEKDKKHSQTKPAMKDRNPIERNFYKQYVHVEEREQEQCHIINVAGDGNCFYRAIQILLGNDEEYYMSLKQSIHDFAKKNMWYTLQAGNPRVTLARIRKNHEFAMFEDIFLTANSLQRDIHVYLGQYPQGQCYRFESEVGPSDPQPLRVLHTGPRDHGHFQAIVPTRSEVQQQQPQQAAASPRQMEIEQPSSPKPSESKQTIDKTEQSKPVDSKMAKKPQASSKNNKNNNQKTAQDKELKSQTIFHCACLRKDQGYTKLGWYKRHMHAKHQDVVPEGSSHDLEGKPVSDSGKKSPE